MSNTHFWEDEEQVKKFASREPDRRLSALIEQYADPSKTRVLDLGCAGGRNTELLAFRGFDVIAIDMSAAMIQRTRERIASILGEAEAKRRVRRGKMDDLSEFSGGYFDLLVALGIFHSATSSEEWKRALDEAVRVMAPGGLMLVSTFTPRADLTGEGITPVDGEVHLYEGLPSGRHYLVNADELDRDMARRGLEPVMPTDTVEVHLEKGRRVSANGLYRKSP